MKQNRHGKIVIISSPSGGGKTSICHRLLSPTRRKQGWQFSVSYTTRERRPGEKNGREYHFVTDRQFDRQVRQGAFAEHFRVHLYRYGTPRPPLEKAIKSGGVMVLDVDVQGALRLRKIYPQAITIFVLPPSRTALRERLQRRGTESQEQLRVRRKNALKEMKLYHRFEYVVINDDLATAVSEVLAIVRSHHCRTVNHDQKQMRKITG
ncbi:MAG: guanylate kinase [bacterium]